MVATRVLLPASAFVLVLTLALVSRSSAGALLWSDPAPLNTNAATDSGHDSWPRLATDHAGNWVAVWYSNDTLGGTILPDHDILAARSADNGSTWTAPQPVNNDADSETGTDQAADVATDGKGTWIAVWQRSPALSTPEDIMFARSTNNGATWTDPVPLNTDAGTDTRRDASPRITTDGNGNWIAVWYDNNTFDVWSARSHDNGLTWSAPQMISRGVANDYYPAIHTDGNGTWIAAWQSDDPLDDTIGDDYDILFVRSTNNGATWSDPLPLNANAVTDGAAFDLNPSLAADGKGNWVAVWDVDDFDIYSATSSNNGQTWSAPLKVSGVAVNDTPHVATDGSGNWIVAWNSNDSLGGTIGSDYDIIFARSTDVGGTWTAPQALNTNAAADSGGDFAVQLGTDRQSRWLAVWNSSDDLGGIGTDGDILFATATIPLPTPTATPTPSPTPAPTPEATPTPSPTPTPTPAATATPTPASTPTPTPTPGEVLQGDVDCNGLVNTVDALMVLREVADLAHTAECMNIAGDVNCDGVVNSIDALGVLRFVAALPPLTAPDGCAAVGTPL